ncbi:aminodeoxyfutalosine deaminase [Acrocarpospora phusangensis]|uniref:Aminodeoxyfutalosine deaminase n=1 Tax=Acrocarpospora phusangensis TaxID=1070424 RepID=A0A919QHH7_9ACTN|nr:adenosine deaminase [Acrocarpospora phusangensis]GIH28883.1 aminodeoxyfutalosine deaminase [Acrocarpospora phusangensis]
MTSTSGTFGTSGTATDLTEFIAGLPKAELHVHHVGSASPRIVAELAARHEGSTIVPADPDQLASFFDFRDFGHFIEVYVAVVDLIRDPEDLWALIYGVGTDLAAQNSRYTELTITPYTHLLNGFGDEQFCEIIEDARRRVEADHGTILRWCFDIPGEYGVASAERTLRLALDQRPDGLISFGLGGPEVGVSREQFAPYFAEARAAGLRSVPHAGETTGPETVWDAINFLGAERIGHGIASAQDPELLAYLAEHQIPLEVCPTSNICTKAVPTLADHPLPALVAAGVPVTINSDDPPMFSTTLNQEYAVAAHLLNLDPNGIADLARNAVHASFLDEPGKRTLLSEIDAYTSQWLSRPPALQASTE